MKIRQSFVSNSSSSSFIVGIAKVENEEKLRQYLADNELSAYEDNIIRVCDIEKDNYWCITNDGKKITVESFKDSVFIKGCDDFDRIFVLNISNDEGDCAFRTYSEYDDDDWGDLNYDIDIDFLPKEQEKLYYMFSNPYSGLSMTSKDIAFGAGRNG